MRILVQDFSGHPFQAQLSRELARRGHEVVHTSCSGYVSGQGALARRPGDPPTLGFRSIPIRHGFDKYRYHRRLVQEIGYGVRLARLVRRERPDVLLSCNEPLLAKAVLGAWCAVARQRSVYWLQDLYSVAMRRELTRILGAPGGWIGRVLEALERSLVRRADGVVVISPAFDRWLAAHGIAPENAATIPNWAPLDELPYHPEDRGWFQRVGVPVGAPVVLYSGTLGRKHDASLFVEAAARLEPDGVEVVVISEGPAASAIAEASGRHPNLRVLPFQPWEDFADILASAAVLVAILAPEAAAYSVPSKVLSYLCAGRPIVASMADDNLAADYISTAGAGAVVAPGDVDGFVTAVRSLVEDRDGCTEAGKRARAFAERTFAIDQIGDRFEAVLAAAADPTTGGLR